MRWLQLCVVAAAGLAACKSAPTPVPAAAPEAPATWVRPPRPAVVAEATRITPTPRRQATLPNGLRVVVVPRRGRPIVSTRLVFLEGVATEPADARGATMLATALLGDLYEINARGAPIPGEETLRAKVWYKGAAYHWDVAHDHVSIGIDGFSSDVEAYLKWLRQTVAEPRRGEYMFSARRDAVIHALEDLEISDDITLFRVLERAAFGVKHPYARAIEGTQSSLRRIGYEQVVTRQDNLLNPARAVLIVVGDVEPERVLREAQATLGAWVPRNRRATSAGRLPAVPREKTPRVALIGQPEAQLVTICSASPVRDASVSDVALEGLAENLGGGLRSRLVERLRVQSGLVYFAQTQVVRRRHARALIACTRTPARLTAEVLAAMKGVFADAAARPPSAREVRRIRAQLYARRRADRASVAAITADEVDRAARGVTGASDPAEISALEGAQIQAAASALLDAAEVQFVLAGPRGHATAAAHRAGLGRVRTVSAVW